MAYRIVRVRFLDTGVEKDLPAHEAHYEITRNKAVEVKDFNADNPREYPNRMLGGLRLHKRGD